MVVSDNLTRSGFGNNGGASVTGISQYTLSAYKVDTATRDGGYDMTGDGAALVGGGRYKVLRYRSWITSKGFSNAWDV